MLLNLILCGLGRDVSFGPQLGAEAVFSIHLVERHFCRLTIVQPENRLCDEKQATQGYRPRPRQTPMRHLRGAHTSVRRFGGRHMHDAAPSYVANLEGTRARKRLPPRRCSSLRFVAEPAAHARRCRCKPSVRASAKSGCDRRQPLRRSQPPARPSRRYGAC